MRKGFYSEYAKQQDLHVACRARACGCYESIFLVDTTFRLKQCMHRGKELYTVMARSDVNGTASRLSYLWLYRRSETYSENTDGSRGFTSLSTPADVAFLYYSI